MPPVKNRPMMTSYGGIIRIRVKGRSWMTSSQPATQAPLFLLIVIIHWCGIKKVDSLFSRIS